MLNIIYILLLIPLQVIAADSVAERVVKGATEFTG